MFLALTSQTEFWDRDDELLFIGSWCARHDRRDDWSRLRHRFLAEPWEDLDRFRAAVAYCDALVEHLLPAFTLHLNRIHSVRFGEKYWRILIGRWLVNHVQHLYGHYTRVGDAFAAYPEIRGVRLDPGAFQTPRNTQDALELTLKDTFNLQVLSHFLEIHGDRFPARPLGQNTQEKFVLRTPNRAKTLIKRALTRLLALGVPLGFGEVLVADLNISKEEQRAFIFGSKFRVLPYLAELPDEFQFEPVWDDRRRGLSGVMTGRDEFERILISTLPLYFPTLYLEGYRRARAFSLSRLWRTPRIIFSAVGWYANDAFKFAAAESAEQGAELRGLQHGGVYGQYEHADGERFERTIVDRYYTWGWASGAGDPRLKDLPHPMLSRVGARNPGDEIVFVPTVILFHAIRLSRAPNARSDDYLRREAAFLNALPEPLQNKTVTRLFHLDYGWRHVDRLRTVFSNLRLDEKNRTFSERLRTARLVVFDCPMTTFLEALAADVPSVFTWDPDLWVMRPEARPFFDRLAAAGIFFADPAAAARHVERIYDDPRTWWDSPAVREARESFAGRYALHRNDWLDSWLAETRDEA